MTGLLPNILSILVIAEFVLGNAANVFIALVNCSDWVKGQKLSCADQILTALAVSRIGLLWIIIFHWCAVLFNLAFYNSEVKTIVLIVWVINNHLSLWLATGLIILYLLKIANFSSLFFLHLKWKAKRVVVIILLGALVFLVCHLAAMNLEIKVGMNEYEGNITWMTYLRDIVHLSNMTVFTIAHIIPFAVSLTAFLLLIFSLWKHLKKMQLSGKGSQDASTKVHVRAMQTVISFLLLFFIYFLIQVTFKWISNNLKNNFVRTFSQVLTLLYPSCHSFILIWGNKKLRQAVLSILHQLRCYLKERNK